MPIEVMLEGIPAGYTLKSVKKGEPTDVLLSEFTSSEDGDHFIQRIEGITSFLLNSITQRRYIPSSIDHLFSIIYPDKRAIIYINELEQILLIQAKKSIIVGQPVSFEDVADIRELSFRGIEIPNNAGLVFLFSVGWRKGLFYDLTPLHNEKTKLQYKPEIMFGQLYSYLSFQEIFKITTEDWDKLFAQQWFPFISLQRNTIIELIDRVRNDWDIDEMIEKIQDEVLNRLEPLLIAWKKNPVFQEHLSILEQAAERYHAKDYISSISILFPRIEGIMRSYHRAKQVKDEATQKNLVTSVIEIGGAKTHSYSFLLPNRFDAYLRQVYFANFDPNDPKNISRNTVSHGLAPTKDFSLKSATIALLLVDQITYFLRE